MRLLHLAATAAALTLPALLAAQGAATPAARPTDGVPSVVGGGIAADSALAEMRAALRGLVTREEAHFAAHGTYTTDLAALGLYGPGAPKRGAAMAQVIFAGGRGWSAVATHRGLRGKSCVLYVGPAAELPKLPATAADHREAIDEATPTCDRP